MEKTTVKAQSKYLRQSPYKMRLVLNLIRGLDVQDALNVLTFTKRKAATDLVVKMFDLKLSTLKTLKSFIIMDTKVLATLTLGVVLLQ